MATRRDDVRDLAAALATVSGSLERGRRRSRGATTLSTLQAVAARGPVRPTDIASEVGLHHSSITRQIQTLQQLGLVQVGPDPDDGRASAISLTERGASEMERLLEHGVDRFVAFVADWDVEDVRRLAELLWRFEESKARVGPPRESFVEETT
ncbi:MAG TPA: MarR family transcriptional regulator [Candidatus Dormibacteraeota bacterium]|jgi:DNA-binding MarR family transcriptional regulator|nr:MarR family transcriptional regulator [Candidatus Dormibacteraeota bacterium]